MFTEAVVQALQSIASAIRGIAPSSVNDWTAASGVLSYSSADSPIFVAGTTVDLSGAVGPGKRIKLVQSGTTKYFIVVAISSTTITLYGGTDYTLANAAISDVYYSGLKAPFGFPLDPEKWTVTATDTANRETVGPTINVWYNAFSFSIPIGSWLMKSKSHPYGYDNDGGSSVQHTISTANNSESDAELTVAWYFEGAVAAAVLAQATGYVEKPIIKSAKATHYLNYRTVESGMVTVGVGGATIKSIVRLVCAYL